jgi:hypothetical protein
MCARTTNGDTRRRLVNSHESDGDGKRVERMSSDMDDDKVEGLAEYWAATIGIPWEGLTPVQQENYRKLARERLAEKKIQQ